MAVKAKFMVTSVKHETGDRVTVELQAASGATEANKQWSKWTPSGYLEMMITNPGAAEQFKPGAYWFLDMRETTESAVE